MVRVFDPVLDGVSPLQFHAGDDRHVAQHNLMIAQAHSPVSVDIDLDLGYPAAQTMAELVVEPLDPASINWLQLYAWQRNYKFNRPSIPITAGFSAPYLAAGAKGPPTKQFRPKVSFKQTCAPLKVHFHASADNLNPDDAQVLRLRHIVGGKTVGGYTVVLLKQKEKV